MKNIENRLDYFSGEKIIIEQDFIRTARSHYKIKVPRFNQNLAYLAGYHLGDGYLEDSQKTFLRTGRASFEITYADSDRDQIKMIDAIFRTEFGVPLNIYNPNNANLWLGRFNSCKVLHWFLSEKLGLPVGKKKKISIPSWIPETEDFLSSFISGFFDAEADIGITIVKDTNN